MAGKHHRLLPSSSSRLTHAIDDLVRSQSISDWTPRSAVLFAALIVMMKNATAYTGSFISSGLLDLLIEGVLAHEQRGVKATDDTNRFASLNVLVTLGYAASQRECHGPIRAKCAGALKWLLVKEHEIEYLPDFGMTSISSAAGISAFVFGRDEGESQFRFSQYAVDLLYVPSPSANMTCKFSSGCVFAGSPGGRKSSGSKHLFPPRQPPCRRWRSSSPT